MLYELATAPPEPGSLLELLFQYVARMKAESHVLGIRVLVDAVRSIVPEDTSGNVETLNKTLEAFMDRSLPYIGAEKKKKSKQDKALLQDWVGKGAIRVSPMYRPSDNKAYTSRIRKGQEIVQRLEAERARGKKRKL